MALRRLDPYRAAEAMAAHHVELAHTCWLVRTPAGGLSGCPVGALFYAAHGMVPLDQRDAIDWAIALTHSRAYVQGFDSGFHGFMPVEHPSHSYTLGRADGQRTRLLVEDSRTSRPALWCWQNTENR